MSYIIGLIGFGLFVMAALTLAQFVLMAAIALISVIVALPVHIAKQLTNR